MREGKTRKGIDMSQCRNGSCTKQEVKQTIGLLRKRALWSVLDLVWMRSGFLVVPEHRKPPVRDMDPQRTCRPTEVVTSSAGVCGGRQEKGFWSGP